MQESIIVTLPPYSLWWLRHMLLWLYSCRGSISAAKSYQLPSLSDLHRVGLFVRYSLFAVFPQTPVPYLCLCTSLLKHFASPWQNGRIADRSKVDVIFKFSTSFHRVEFSSSFLYPQSADIAGLLFNRQQ